MLYEVITIGSLLLGTQLLRIVGERVGTFRVLAAMKGYSHLDHYGMGLLPVNDRNNFV